MQKLYLLLVFSFFFSFSNAQDAPFITTWEVPGYYLEITIPTEGDGYNFTIDFGDGTVLTNQTGNVSHTYNSGGTYTVSISGDFPRIYFNGSGDASKIQSVEQWGDIQWQNMGSAFQGCDDLKINATDTPDLSQVTDLSYMFQGCKYFNSDINNWDVSNVTDMSHMFSGSSYSSVIFNQPLNNWDVSNVTDMSEMFYKATSFNQPLNNWDVSNVTNMEKMFKRTVSFKQAIDNWDVSNVTNMKSMFYGNSGFNQSIDNWDVSSVTNMSKMFFGATSFNQSINNWDVSSVTDMSEMFYKATSFNQSINNWDVSNVTNMGGMFSYTDAFNQPLNDWDVSNVTNMQKMFNSSNHFNQPLNNWDVSNVTNMGGMFSYTDAFNQPLNNWDVSSVVDMSSMFSKANRFNQPLNNWEISNVTNINSMFNEALVFNQNLNNWDVSNVTNMDRTFSMARLFNQPLDNWDVSNVSDMSGMFSGASTFNQDISNWNFNPLIDLNFYFLSGCGLDINNYDALLNRFLELNLENKSINAGNLVFCDQETRTSLIEELGWEISGDMIFHNCDTSFSSEAFVTKWRTSLGLLDITIPTVGDGYNYTIDFGDGTIETDVTGDITHNYAVEGVYRVQITGDFPRIYFNNDNNASRLLSVEQWGDIEWESMENAFLGCSNLVLEALDTPDLTMVSSLSKMFKACYSLNQPINNWDISNVTNLSYLFEDASIFNQDLSNWNVSNVITMEGLFKNAKVFNQPLNNWNVSNVINMSKLFDGSKYYDKPIDTWNVSNVNNMERMFSGALVFNQSIESWDVSNVNNMSSMFAGASEFNQPVNSWDVSNVTDMSAVFRAATLFNQPIANWDVENVTNMHYIFAEASSFNQPLDNWNVANVLDMRDAFSEAISFDQNLSNWQLNTGNLAGFLYKTALSSYNYDNFLLQLSSLEISGDLILGAGELEYCLEPIHSQLQESGWNIYGDSLGQECDPYNFLNGNISYNQNGENCNENNSSSINLGIINILNNEVNIGITPNDDGYYSYYLNNGDYEISLINTIDYYSVTPQTTTINFDGSFYEQQLNFCLTANQTVEDLSITLLPISEARPGFEADYQLVVENMGTQSLATANISLIFDDTKQSFLSATPAETSSTSNQLNFEVNNLPPFGQKIIDFTMETFQPPTVNGNDILNFTANVSPDTNDYTPENNTFVYDQIVVNSFDPNDKKVLQGEQVHIDKADQYLDYLIRFQNTGTASAINVRILDTLHPDLDYSTIKPISASADYRVEINDNNEVEFIFDNIYLPHEDENEPESHGFVAYKIKPKASIAIGDVITGDASIFFDFNPPIITNTVSTEFVDDLRTESYTLENLIQIYPNPVNDFLSIKIAENIQLKNLKLYNLQGQELLQFPQSIKRINLSQLSAGMYILKIETDQGSINKRLLKK